MSWKMCEVHAIFYLISKGCWKCKEENGMIKCECCKEVIGNDKDIDYCMGCGIVLCDGCQWERATYTFCLACHTIEEYKNKEEDEYLGGYDEDDLPIL